SVDCGGRIWLPWPERRRGIGRDNTLSHGAVKKFGEILRWRHWGRGPIAEGRLLRLCSRRENRDRPQRRSDGSRLTRELSQQVLKRGGADRGYRELRHCGPELFRNVIVMGAWQNHHNYLLVELLW